MHKKWIIFPAVLFLFACAKPQTYVSSRVSLETFQPDREIIPAPRGCDVCHKIFADRLVYNYYQVRISHRAHSKLGIQCVFCHRKAPASTKTEDYLLPEGHGFFDNSLDRNPCRICHIYSSVVEKSDRRMPARCETCHRTYSGGKLLSYSKWRFNTNLRNNHKTHYDKGLPCLRCHAGFDQVEDIVPNYIPKMDICTECHGATEGKRKVGEEKGSETFDAAAEIFLRNCAMCHGPEGKGNGPVAALIGGGVKVRDLTDHEYMSRRTDGDLFMVIFEGGQSSGLSERMPAFKGLLSGGDISLLVKQIRRISGS